MLYQNCEFKLTLTQWELSEMYTDLNKQNVLFFYNASYFAYQIHAFAFAKSNFCGIIYTLCINLLSLLKKVFVDTFKIQF